MIEIKSVPHSSSTSSDSEKPVSARQIISDLSNKKADNIAIQGAAAMTQEIQH